MKPKDNKPPESPSVQRLMAQIDVLLELTVEAEECGDDSFKVLYDELNQLLALYYEIKATEIKP